MSPATKFGLFVFGLMAVVAGGLGYWFYASTRPPPSIEPPTAAVASDVSAKPADDGLGAVEAQLKAYQHEADTYSSASRWTDLEKTGQDGLKLVEGKVGSQSPARLRPLSWELFAAIGLHDDEGAKRVATQMLEEVHRSGTTYNSFAAEAYVAQGEVAVLEKRFADAAIAWKQAYTAGRAASTERFTNPTTLLCLAQSRNAFIAAGRAGEGDNVLKEELNYGDNVLNRETRIDSYLRFARACRTLDPGTALFLAESAEPYTQGRGRDLDPQALEVDVAVADLTFRVSGRPRPKGTVDPDPNFEQTIEQMTQESTHQRRVGKYQDSVDVSQRLLAMVEAKTGRTGVEYATALEIAASAEGDARLFQAAEKDHREAIALIESAEGPESYALEVPLNNLATFLEVRSEKNSPEVEKLLRRALAIEERFEGPLAEGSSLARGNLGFCLTQLRQGDRAERSLRESIAIEEWYHGGTTYAMASAYYGLYKLRLADNRLADALPFLEQAAAGPSEGPQTRGMLVSLVWLQRRLGKLTETGFALFRLVTFDERTYGKDSLITFLDKWKWTAFEEEMGDATIAVPQAAELVRQYPDVYSRKVETDLDPRGTQ